MADYKAIALDVDPRGVATLTLNRPEKHNALNAEMIAELTHAANEISQNASIRAVILASTGKSWCAGGDLSWMQAQAKNSRSERETEGRKLADMLHALNSLPQFLISRVHGGAYGGGVGLMSVSDVVVAVENAPFGLTETKLGLTPATIGPYVVRRMGEGFARQVFFTSKPFSTDFGLRCGLVSETCEPHVLDEVVETYITAILKCAPNAVAKAKASCQRLSGDNPNNCADGSIQQLADQWETDEAREGIDAFFGRRKPDWVPE